MRLVTALTVATVMLTAASVSLHAQGRGNGQAKKTTASAPKASAQSPKQTAKTTQQTAKTDARVAKADARATKAAVKAETRAAKTETKAVRKSGTPAATTTASTTTTPTTVVTPTTPTTTSVKNPKLEARLLAMLPPGSTIQEASLGFKNWGQFVAATHVSNNLKIPFAELKARMTGITPGALPGTTVQTTPMSLGQAIQSWGATAPTTTTNTLTPTKVQTEVKKAEDAANADLRRTRESS